MAGLLLIAPLQQEHGDPVIVANAAIWSMTGVAAVFLGLRLACRLTLARTWWDDWLLLAGLLAMVAASGLFSELLRLGFARTTLVGEPLSLLLIVLDSVQKVALACTKTSFSLTLLRVFPPGGWQRGLVLALLLVLNAYLAVNMTFSWVVICQGEQANRITTTCITAKNQATLNTLQMRPMEKLGAAVAMSLGALYGFPHSKVPRLSLTCLPRAGVAGIMKGVQTFRIMNPFRPDFFYQVWVFQVWNIAEPCVTIVAASIPVLRAFVRGAARGRGPPPSALPAAAGPYSMSNGAGKFAAHAGAAAASSAIPAPSAGNDDDDDDEPGREPGVRASSPQRGITRTRRFTVEFNFRDAGRRDEDAYELHPAHRCPNY